MLHSQGNLFYSSLRLYSLFYLFGMDGCNRFGPQPGEPAARGGPSHHQVPVRGDRETHRHAGQGRRGRGRAGRAGRGAARRLRAASGAAQGAADGPAEAAGAAPGPGAAAGAGQESGAAPDQVLCGVAAAGYRRQDHDQGPRNQGRPRQGAQDHPIRPEQGRGCTDDRAGHQQLPQNTAR